MSHVNGGASLAALIQAPKQQEVEGVLTYAKLVSLAHAAYKALDCPSEAPHSPYLL